MNDDTRAYNRLTAKQTFEVMKLLEANGSVSGEHYAFHDGWSDERIAKDVGVPVVAVQSRRRDVFGKLMMSGPHGSRNDERFAALEQNDREMRVKTFQLEQRVASLEKAINIFLTAGSKDGGPITSDMLRRLKEHYNGRPSP